MKMFSGNKPYQLIVLIYIHMLMGSDTAKELQNDSSTEQPFLTIWDNSQICLSSVTCWRKNLNQINIKLAQELPP